MVVGPPRPGRRDGQTDGDRVRYDQIGKVAVMHEGRVKPLDTVAREEVKQVYSRETITIRDPRGRSRSSPTPTRSTRRARRSGRSRSGGRSALPRLDRPAGVLGRSAVHPRRLPPVAPAVVAGPIEARLKAIADKPTTRPRRTACEAGRRSRADRHGPDRVRPRLQAAGRGPRVHRRARRQADRGHKWLTPASSRRRRSPAGTERPLPFMSWARGQRQRSGSTRTRVRRAAHRARAPRHRRRPAADDLPGL